MGELVVARSGVVDPVNGGWIGDRKFEPLFSEIDVATAVNSVATNVAEYYGSNERPPVAVGVLKGAALFLADLVRAAQRNGLPLQYDTIRVGRYGNNTVGGQLRFRQDFDPELIAGRDVLLVEDLVDGGTTVQQLATRARFHGAASVAVAALLDKPEAHTDVDLGVDECFFGLSVPAHAFVAGYGMDYQDEGRGLPHIVQTDR